MSADPVVNRTKVAEVAEVAEREGHVYLSTGCLHGEHAYCQARTGAVGVKVPATCKFCAAPCVCPCHREAEVETETEAEIETKVGADASEGESDREAGLDLVALRAHVSRRLLAVGTARVTREWICCDPVKTGHRLCAEGRDLLEMLRGLLVDDEAVFPPTGDLLDEVMRLLQGYAAAGEERHVLAPEATWELYQEAVTRGLQAVLDWGKAGNLEGVRAEVIRSVTSAVATVRDQELTRNRQRLLLAGERQLDAARNLEAARAACRREVAAARVSERLTVLGEVGKLFQQVSAAAPTSPLYRTLFTWLRRAETAAKTAQRELKRDQGEKLTRGLDSRSAD